jgi:hypothetical protein
MPKAYVGPPVASAAKNAQTKIETLLFLHDTLYTGGGGGGATDPYSGRPTIITMIKMFRRFVGSLLLFSRRNLGELVTVKKIQCLCDKQLLANVETSGCRS